MSDHMRIPPQPPAVDRHTRLIALGVVQLCFGALGALLTLLILFGMVTMLAMDPASAAAAGMSPRLTLMGMAVYGAMAAWFLTMGVGSILARRWARALDEDSHQRL